MADFDIPDEKNGAWDYYQSIILMMMMMISLQQKMIKIKNINIQTWQEDQKLTWITLILILR